MANVADILQHIAQALNLVKERRPRASAAELPTGQHFRLRLCATADVEATELEYMQLYGKGHTLYFRIRSHEQAQQLTADLFGQIGTLYPDASIYSPIDEGEACGQLYLFIHIHYRPRRRLKLQDLRRGKLQPPFHLVRA